MARIVALAAVFVLNGGLGSVSAQNLLVNPDFDINLDGWTPAAGTVFDPTRDVAGAASGSARWTGTVAVPFGGAVSGVFQCVSGLTPATSYSFGGSSLLTSVPAFATSNIHLQFYSDASCSAGLALFSALPVAEVVGVWVESSAIVVAPAGTQSAQIFQNVNADADAGDFDVNYDRMFLQEVGAVPVTSAPALIVLALALLLTALATFRRLRTERA